MVHSPGPDRFQVLAKPSGATCNLYQFNAEEEPEVHDYPKQPMFRQMFEPRGILRFFATDVDDPTEDPHFGWAGQQTIEDTGPLTRKRIETIDDDVTERTILYVKKAHTDGKPFFI